MLYKRKIAGRGALAIPLLLLLLFTFSNDVLAKQQQVREQQEPFNDAIDGLKKTYKRKLQPLEEMFSFESFTTETIDDSFFDAKPMVLLLGPFSTGKTTFIRYLLQSDFPGMKIGAVPTTDCFIAIMYGEQIRSIKGEVLIRDKTKPFGDFGLLKDGFLEHFKGSTLPNSVLKNITIIDTPGIPTTQDHRMNYGDDFAKIISAFAEKADMILLFFDAHKMAVSDEYRRVISSIAKHRKKLNVVLNKAAELSTYELNRVTGKLMFDLGKVVNKLEYIDMYIGSFWNGTYEHNDLFEEAKLFARIESLTETNVMDKVVRIFKRARQVRTHAHILCHLRNEMPSKWSPLNWFSWSSQVQKKQRDLIDNLEREFEKIQLKSKFEHEFPDMSFRVKLRKFNFMDFPTCDEAGDQLITLESMFKDEGAQISQLVENEKVNKGTNSKSGPFRGSSTEL